MLIAFILGSLATVFSTIVTYKVLPLSKYLGENGWKIGSALAARHIGGAINFVAVAETLNVDSGSIVSAAIAADNVVVGLYFALLFYLAIPGKEGEDNQDKGTDSSIVENNKDEKDEFIVVADIEKNKEESMSMQSISIAITVASCIVTLGKIITGTCLPTGTSVSIYYIFMMFSSQAHDPCQFLTSQSFC